MPSVARLPRWSQRLPACVPAARRVRGRGALVGSDTSCRTGGCPGAATLPRPRAEGGLGLIAPADGDHAEVRVVDGRTYVSPWRMRMRVAAGLAFRETRPIELGALPFEERCEARGPRAGPPSARPARGGVLSPEPVARADPVSLFVDEERRLGTSTGSCGSGIGPPPARRSDGQARRSRSCEGRTWGRSATS